MFLQYDFAALVAENKTLMARLALAEAKIAALEKSVVEDDLTGLTNRRGFFSDMERCLAFSKRYGFSAGVMFVDLDRFKCVNDEYGHAAGDTVLRAVAHALRDQFRSSDLVARIGGDEFAILLWNSNREDIKARACDVAECISGLDICIDCQRLPPISASVGIALARDGDNVTSLMKRADDNMYRVKHEHIEAKVSSAA